MTLDTAFWVVVFVVGLFLGWRACYRLARRFHDTWGVLVGRERLILFAIVVVAWLIAAFATLVGFLSLRSALGFTPLEWGRFAVIAFSCGVVYVPAFLSWVVERVARGDRES